MNASAICPASHIPKTGQQRKRSKSPNPNKCQSQGRGASIVSRVLRVQGVGGLGEDEVTQVDGPSSVGRKLVEVMDLSQDEVVTSVVPLLISPSLSSSLVPSSSSGSSLGSSSVSELITSDNTALPLPTIINPNEVSYTGIRTGTGPINSPPIVVVTDPSLNNKGVPIVSLHCDIPPTRMDLIPSINKDVTLPTFIPSIPSTSINATHPPTTFTITPVNRSNNTLPPPITYSTISQSNYPQSHPNSQQYQATTPAWSEPNPLINSYTTNSYNHTIDGESNQLSISDAYIKAELETELNALERLDSWYQQQLLQEEDFDGRFEQHPVSLTREFPRVNDDVGEGRNGNTNNFHSRIGEGRSVEVPMEREGGEEKDQYNENMARQFHNMRTNFGFDANTRNTFLRRPPTLPPEPSLVTGSSYCSG